MIARDFLTYSYKRIRRGYIRMVEYHHTESVSGHFSVYDIQTV